MSMKKHAITFQMPDGGEKELNITLTLESVSNVCKKVDVEEYLGVLLGVALRAPRYLLAFVEEMVTRQEDVFPDPKKAISWFPAEKMEELAESLVKQMVATNPKLYGPVVKRIEDEREQVGMGVTIHDEQEGDEFLEKMERDAAAAEAAQGETGGNVKGKAIGT